MRMKMPVIAFPRISFSLVVSIIAVSNSSGVSGLGSSSKSLNEGIVLAVKFANKSCNNVTTIPCKCGNESLYSSAQPHPE
jgi:hypothetical protein